MEDTNTQKPVTLEDLKVLLEKHEQILQKMESRAKLQAVFFWIKMIGIAFAAVVSIGGALWYAQYLGGIMQQIDMIGK